MTLQHYAGNKTKLIPETILAITSCWPNRNESYPNVFNDCSTASNASINKKKSKFEKYLWRYCSLNLVNSKLIESVSSIGQNTCSKLKVKTCNKINVFDITMWYFLLLILRKYSPIGFDYFMTLGSRETYFGNWSQKRVCSENFRPRTSELWAKNNVIKQCSLFAFA